MGGCHSGKIPKGASKNLLEELHSTHSNPLPLQFRKAAERR
jgi:hypothetical protein